MSIPVVGGAAYIGSHMFRNLSSSAYEIVTFDNLPRGYREAVLMGEFVEGDPAILAVMQVK